MPDSRNHRGAHPEDARDFASPALARLRDATHELSYLFTRDYAPDAALKLVGDHHQLTARQRKAVLRAACGDPALARRAQRRLTSGQLREHDLAVDGFNCLISVEAMLAGAPILRGRDHALRDLASVHGTYRSVRETERALSLILAALVRYGVRRVTLLLDRPVGNSGRTRAAVVELAAALPLSLEVRLSERVDPELAATADVVASSDSWILDRCARWIDLPAAIARDEALPIWLVDLAESAE